MIPKLQQQNIKLSEAILSQSAERWRAIKGAPAAVASRVKTAIDFSKDVERLAAHISRLNRPYHPISPSRL
jgi:hypothetical protein